MTVFHPNDPGIVDRFRGAEVVPTPTAEGHVDIGPARLYRLPRYDDPRGTLVVNQAPEDLPFVPVRMFQVFDVPAAELRGDHAHRRSHQLVMALTGSVCVVVDDGVTRHRVRLDSPELGLHIRPMTWSIQGEFAPDARVLVLASEPYDRGEYIDDYEEFRATVRALAEPEPAGPGVGA